jgi:cytochrome c oxidase assembly protein subunit 11
MATQSGPGKSRNAVVATAVVAVVAGMVGMSFAAVPLYRLFCQVTGFGGTTQVAGQVTAAPAPAGGPDGRAIRVTLDATVNSGLPWSFAPEKPFVDLKVGEQTLVNYVARNLSDKAVTGVATFNVTPHKIGAYFDKIQCFCFTEQTLKPGERVVMPVVFFVDPAIAGDRNADDVTDIVLSYTFFRAEAPDPGRREVRAPASPATPANPL